MHKLSHVVRLVRLIGLVIDNNNNFVNNSSNGSVTTIDARSNEWSVLVVSASGQSHTLPVVTLADLTDKFEEYVRVTVPYGINHLVVELSERCEGVTLVVRPIEDIS